MWSVHFRVAHGTRVTITINLEWTEIVTTLSAVWVQVLVG